MQLIGIQPQPQKLLAGFSFFGDPFHSHAGWTEDNEIGRLWKRLGHYLETTKGQADHDGMYEVFIQNTETPITGEFEVFVGFEVPSADEVSFELSLKVLPAATYVLFLLQGSHMQQDGAFFDDWLAENGYKQSYPLFIQRYDHRFKGLDKLDESALEFWAPVVHK